MDIKVKFEIDPNCIEGLIQSKIQKMESKMEKISKAVISDAYDEAVRLAGERLKTSRSDYIKGLDYYPLGDGSWVLELQGEQANTIENGWAAFNAKEALLNGPNAKVSETTGRRYNVVPFDRTPKNMPIDTKGMRTMKDAVQKLIRNKGLDRIFRDDSGNDMEGIVKSITGSETDNPMIKNLSRIQTSVKGKTRSTFVTFVGVGEDSTGWDHPSYAGAKIFPDIEKFIMDAVTEILASDK